MSVLADRMPLLHKDCNFDEKLDSDLLEIQEDIEVPSEIKEWVEDKPKPNLDQTTSFILGTLENPKLIQIGSNLTPNQRNDMVTLLTQFQDVLAWSHEDMVGLSTDIVLHRLPIKEGFKPVKQKFR